MEKKFLGRDQLQTQSDIPSQTHLQIICFQQDLRLSTAFRPLIHMIPALLLLPACIVPTIIGLGEGLARQIKVAISKPLLILPSVREQKIGQDRLHKAN